jgi:serine/threonine protein kinase
MEFPQLRGDMSFINESIKVFNTDGGKRFSGSFGKAGRINVRGTYYFTKSIINTFPNKRMFDYELQSILNEVNIAFDATSKIPDYVSNIHGSFIDINPEQLSITAYLIFEGPDGMSLTDYIKNYNPNDPRNSDLYKKIYCMIKKTQVAFNSIGYVHRDLKPDNIYVNLRPLKFKLIDFGMAIKKNTIALGGGSPIFMPKHAFDAFSRGLAIPQTESLNSHSINKIWELGPIYDPKKKETIWLGFNQKGAPPDCSAMGGGKRRRKATQYKRNNKNRRTRKQRAAKP